MNMSIPILNDNMKFDKLIELIRSQEREDLAQCSGMTYDSQESNCISASTGPCDNIHGSLLSKRIVSWRVRGPAI